MHLREISATYIPENKRLKTVLESTHKAYDLKLNSLYNILQFVSLSIQTNVMVNTQLFYKNRSPWTNL